MQGEADASSGRAASVYNHTLAGFMKDIRTYLSVPDLPFTIGKITPPPPAAHKITVTDKQRYVVANDGYAEYVPACDLSMKPDDIWHYDTPSMKTRGNRFGEAVFRLTQTA